MAPIPVSTNAPVESIDTRSKPTDVQEGVALCLSGGGFRAMLFHVVALWRLNELCYLLKLERISSVSGGSITSAVMDMNWMAAGDTNVGITPKAKNKKIVPLFLILYLMMSLGILESLYAADISLTGNQVMLIENATYSNQGQITLSDNSQLIIRNSTFNFDQSYHEQYSIQLFGNASLIIDNNSILTSSYRFLVPSNDDSVVNVSNSRARPLTGSWGAIFQPNDNSTFTATSAILDCVGDMYSYSNSTKASITIQNSTMNALHFHFPLSSIVNLSNIQLGLITNLQLLKNDSGLPYDLVIINTSIENEINAWVKDDSQATFTNCQFHQITPDNQAKVSIVDSDIGAVIVEFGNMAAVNPIIDGLSPGHQPSYAIDLSAYNSVVVSLTNSTIGEWDVKVVNCPGSVISISNSQLGLLRTVNDSSTINFSNSMTDELWVWDTTGTINFSNVVVGNWGDTRNYPPNANNFLLTGTVTFLQADLINIGLGNQWFDSIVRREYPVQIIGVSNIESLTVQALDPDGNVVFSGNPNSNGDVSILLSFNNSNYNKNWRLKVLNGGTLLKEATLTISSNTPMIIDASTPSGGGGGGGGGGGCFIAAAVYGIVSESGK